MSTAPRRLPWRFSPKRYLKNTTLQEGDLLLHGAYLVLLTTLWQENTHSLTRTLSDWASLWRTTPATAQGLLEQLSACKLITLESDPGGARVVSLSLPPSRPRKPKAPAVSVPHPSLPAAPVPAALSPAPAPLAAPSVAPDSLSSSPSRPVVPGVTYREVHDLVSTFRQHCQSPLTSYRIALEFAALLTAHPWSALHSAVHTAPRTATPWTLLPSASAEGHPTAAG